MCLYCILKGLFCIGEGTKTSGHGREQAMVKGQFLGYMRWLIFSKKRNRLTCWFFFLHFLQDYGCTVGINKPEDQHFDIKPSMEDFALYSM